MRFCSKAGRDEEKIMPRNRPHRSLPSARGASHRRLRVGEMLRHALSEILRRHEIRDADLIDVSVTVTEVKPSPDVRHATVFVEPLGGQKAGEVVAALNRHRGFLRGQLGHEIALKFTPELRFVEDTTFAEAERIAKLLLSEKVARDLKAPGKGEGDDGEET
jgi:ribosome-binding factor A